ncbi:MAG: hypothetical protein ACE5H4_15965 [Candidatus Thorarchaeota archaeon]
MKYKSFMYSVASATFAIILLSAALVVGSMGASVGPLPGIPLSESSFAELGTDSLTSMESLTYPTNYEILSGKPYIIRVDYQDVRLISELDAEHVAQQFIDAVFANESIQQLEVDRRSTQLWGALPKWTINFRNNTYSVPIDIEATVTVNAISGEVIGYIGEPILCQGEANNLSIAETYALSILRELNYHLPSDSRLSISNKADAFGLTYRFKFQQVSNGVLIDTEIGTLSLWIDASSGGLRFLSFDWIQIDEIPIDDVLSIDRIGDGAVLSLISVSETGFDIRGPQELRLCWVKDDILSGRIQLLDAFNGELVAEWECLDVAHSQEYSEWIFLIPVLVSLIPAVMLSLWVKKNQQV